MLFLRVQFAHNPSDVNIDRRIVYNAVEIAYRPARNWMPKSIYSFEIFCNGSWSLAESLGPMI